MDEYSSRIKALKTTSEQVSTFVLSHFFNQNFTLSLKKDGSEVTTVDIEAENLAKELLLGAFPEDSFLGEEHAEVVGSSEFRWVVDPIDGTASFAKGVPLFGTLVGLEHNGETIAGAAHLPAMHESITAVKGQGAIHNSQHAALVSSIASIDEAMVCTTSFDYYKQTNSTSLYETLVDSVGSTRGWSDCYGFMLLCTGRIDAVVEPLLKPWDIIPWLPIIKEAGGMYSPIAEGGIASNAKIHDSLYHALHDNTTN